MAERQNKSTARRAAIALHDLTESSPDWLARRLIDAAIDQNARLVGEQAVIRLLVAIAGCTPLLPTTPIEPWSLLRGALPPAGA